MIDSIVSSSCLYLFSVPALNGYSWQLVIVILQLYYSSRGHGWYVLVSGLLCSFKKGCAPDLWDCPCLWAGLVSKPLVQLNKQGMFSGAFEHRHAYQVSVHVWHSIIWPQQSQAYFALEGFLEGRLCTFKPRGIMLSLDISKILSSFSDFLLYFFQRVHDWVNLIMVGFLTHSLLCWWRWWVNGIQIIVFTA